MNRYGRIVEMCRIPVSYFDYSPLRQPCPQGGGGGGDASVLPGRDTPTKNCFIKNKIDAAAGRPSGRLPFITTGGMGASAPIIISKDFNEAKIPEKIMICRV